MGMVKCTGLMGIFIEGGGKMEFSMGKDSCSS